MGPKLQLDWRGSVIHLQFSINAGASPAVVLASEQRNQLRGPGYQSFDLTIQRIIRFGSRYGLTLRWDAFNLFNQTNFGLPNRNVADGPTFGTISSLSGDARIMQLAIRFTF